MTIRVVQITDIHLTAESELYGVDTALSLSNIIHEIKQLSKKPDVIIATGDLAEDGSKASYNRLKGLLGGLGVPVYVLPGNHDDPAEMRAAFNAEEFIYKGATSIENWGFIFVNSTVAGHDHGCVSSSELKQLKKNIDSFNGQPILVALHHTPSNQCPSFDCQLENAEAFTSLLKQHSNVRGVIAGHTHNASEVDAGGHIQFTTPSTFAHVTHAQLGESGDHDDFWDSHHLDGNLQGFRVLDLFAGGAIQSDVHWVSS